MAKQPDDHIAVPGSERVIEYARKQNGRMPAKIFIDGLEKNEKAKVMALLTAFANGKRLHQPLFRHLDGEIWEFKKSQTRIFCFQDGKKLWLLTNGALKKARKCDPADIKRAKKIMAEHLAFSAKRRSRKGK